MLTFTANLKLIRYIQMHFIFQFTYPTDHGAVISKWISHMKVSVLPQ